METQQLEGMPIDCADCNDTGSVGSRPGNFCHCEHGKYLQQKCAELDQELVVKADQVCSVLDICCDSCGNIDTEAECHDSCPHLDCWRFLEDGCQVKKEKDDVPF